MGACSSLSKKPLIRNLIKGKIIYSSKTSSKIKNTSSSKTPCCIVHQVRNTLKYVGEKNKRRNPFYIGISALIICKKTALSPDRNKHSFRAF